MKTVSQSSTSPFNLVELITETKVTKKSVPVTGAISIRRRRRRLDSIRARAMASKQSNKQKSPFYSTDAQCLLRTLRFWAAFFLREEKMEQ